MPVLVELSIVFFMIGLFTIGGGYAMIPLMQSEVVGRGWLTLDELINFFAISESTPGPFAVNTATLIGFQQFQILGAIVATTSVILPSFIIIIIVAKHISSFMDNVYVKSILNGIKAVIAGMIFSIVVNLSIKNIFSKDFFSEGFDYIALFIMFFVFLLINIKKKISPIFIIVISGFLGIILYSIWGYV